MKLIVPYVPGKLQEVTRRVIDTYDLHAHYVQLDGDDAYRRLLARLWDEGQTFVIVEQDIVPWPGAIEELYHCPAWWCSCSYRMLGGGPGIHHGLGCTKVSRHLIEALPGIWDTGCDWSICDQRLFFKAAEIGREVHAHRPPVVHLNPRDLAA